MVRGNQWGTNVMGKLVMHNGEGEFVGYNGGG